MRDRFFAHGPTALIAKLNSEGADLLIEAHFALLRSCIADLVEAGFQPTLIASENVAGSISLLHRLAYEAAVWVTDKNDELGTVPELAADVICALAAFYEVRAAMPPFDSPGSAARFALASQMVGIQETLLTFARLGHFDAVAYRQLARESAQNFGREGANTRHQNLERLKRAARAAFGQYQGGLSKSAWCEENAARYGRKWRAVFDWLNEA
jgi:hypothetical protein